MAIKDYDSLIDYKETVAKKEESINTKKEIREIPTKIIKPKPAEISVKKEKAEVPKKEEKKDIKKEIKKKDIEDIKEKDKKEDIKEDIKEEISGTKEITADTLIDAVTASLSTKGYSAEEFRFYARKAIEEEVNRLNLPKEELEKLKAEALEKSGYGVLEKYLADEDITEIIAQRYDDIYIEKRGIVEKTNAKFASEEEFQNVINKIVGQRGKAINYSHPIVDTTLFDGSRVAAQIPPITPDGATMTIRKFSKKKLTMDDLMEFGSITQEAAEFLKTLVRKKASIIVSGGTGTGKTTILNILSGYIPKNEMIVTIEDTPELVIQSDRVRRMLTRESVGDEKDNIDIKALVKASLRMRPDRIIIGEVRGSEIREYFAGASTGHDGGILTIHSDSPKNLINTRVPILYGSDVSEHTIRLQFTEAVDFIVQLKRYPNGERKIVEIAYVNGMKGDEVNIESVYKGDYENATEMKQVGEIPAKYRGGDSG